MSVKITLGPNRMYCHGNLITIQNHGNSPVSFEFERIVDTPKSPEQILAAERFAHYKTKMEAAKKDMAYWEEKL